MSNTIVKPATAPLRFGPCGRFELRPAERALLADGQPLTVGARAFDLLCVLAERRERLVGKDELLERVWPGLVVEEHNIAAQVSSLRKLLGAHAIATVPGRGYRFTAAVDDAAPAPPPPKDDRLPAARTRFIGREGALAELARLVSQSRLVTLTGVGGCGKTTLALQFARLHASDFADGVTFVDLAPLRDAERVAFACAAAVEVELGAGAPAASQLAQQLASRELLVVLDNCEHVRAGTAALVDALLARPGRLRILATSREPLGVAGEQRCALSALSLPASDALADVRASEAARMFADRARLGLPEFDIDADNAAAVAEVCRRLDGIALAIELAAARVPMLALPELAARLEDRFRLLTGGHAAAERQQTLAATMQWSCELLSPAEAHMLRHVSVCAGGWRLEAAQAIAQSADAYETIALLSALHDKSLLLVERGRGAASAPRYRLLETVRQYAQQQLRANAEAPAAQQRHAAHFLALAESAAPHLRGPEQSQRMARLHEDRDNLALALEACTQPASTIDAAWGLRLAAATARYWLFHEIDLGRRFALAALARERGGADSRARLDTLLGLAAACMHSGRREEGEPHAREALAIAERLGLAEQQAMALGALGSCLSDRDEDQALRCYEQARDLARAGGHTAPLASALNNIGTIAFRRGALDDAEQGFTQALHLTRARGDVRAALINLHNVIRIDIATRRLDRGRTHAAEAERMLRGVSEPVLKLELIEVTADLASIGGAHALAARLWGATLKRYEHAGYERPSEDQSLLDRLVAASRVALGNEAFEHHRRAGEALEVEAAVREVRGWLEPAR